MPGNIGLPSRNRAIRFSRSSSLTRREARRCSLKGLWRNSPRVLGKLMVGTPEKNNLDWIITPGSCRLSAAAVSSASVSGSADARSNRSLPKPCYYLVLHPERSDHALVPLRGILPRGRIPRERPAPSRQWNLRTCLPKPLRIAARSGPLFLDRQCPVGPFQPCRRLLAGLPCRQFRSAQEPARACPGRGHAGHVAESCPLVRAASRGPVNLTFANQRTGS